VGSGGDVGLLGQSAHDAVGGRAVEAPAGGGGEQRSGGAPGEVCLEGPYGGRGEGGFGPLAAFALESQDPVSLVVVEVFDVAGECFGDAQAVEGEQVHEGLGAWPVLAARQDQSAHFVSSESGGLLLLVHGGAVDGVERRFGDGSLADGVAVEPGHGGHSPADAGGGELPTGPGVAELVEDPYVGVGVVDAGGERVDVGLVAEGQPAGEVALVGLAGGRPEADQVAGGRSSRVLSRWGSAGSRSGTVATSAGRKTSRSGAWVTPNNIMSYIYRS